VAPLDDMVGGRVTHVVAIHDYVQIFASGDRTLNIYAVGDDTLACATKLVGLEIKAIHFTEGRMVIAAEGGVILSFDLDMPGFDGPEAFAYFGGRSGPVVVG